jgi:MFS family permease
MKNDENIDLTDINNKYQKERIKDGIIEEHIKNRGKIEDENLLDKYLEYLSFNFQHIKLILILSIYLAGEGFVMIGMSLLIPVISEPWGLTQFQKGFLGGSVFLGFTCGAASAGFLSDTKGRRLAFFIGNLISLTGGIIGIFYSYDFNSLMMSNIVIGLGLGIGIPSIFTLTSELTEKVLRSIIIGGIGYAFILGEIAGCIVAYKYEMYIYLNSNWRILLILRCVFVININK